MLQHASKPTKTATPNAGNHQVYQGGLSRSGFTSHGDYLAVR
ncbi:MAG: hypothetical protein NZM31_13595 [Gemmatales bacterium]|nr:hypothetical protein [Gemmatales bacterium]MDW8388030.1 hypothetical protein [Gemmatales bacterium]